MIPEHSVSAALRHLSGGDRATMRGLRMLPTTEAAGLREVLST